MAQRGHQQLLGKVTTQVTATGDTLWRPPHPDLFGSDLRNSESGRGTCHNIGPERPNRGNPCIVHVGSNFLEPLAAFFTEIAPSHLESMELEVSAFPCAYGDYCIQHAPHHTPDRRVIQRGPISGDGEL